MDRTIEWIMGIAGGLFGWFVSAFDPTFSLILVAFAFIIYDSWSAYELDKRVKKRYPDKKKRPAKYVSYKAWGMIPTMTETCIVILLMFALQKWVFVDLYVPLVYIATGVVCGIQLLSIAENKASCRQPGDKGYKVWSVLAKVLIDKTERHFDMNLGLGDELDIKKREENDDTV